MATRARRREGGFTAIELMVVIGIAIIVAALTIPTVGGMMRSTRLTSSANTCAVMMRTARTMAIASSGVYRLAIDAGGDPVLVGIYDTDTSVHPDGNPHSEARLEGGITASSSHAGRLEFQPDGSVKVEGTAMPPAAYTVELAEEGGRRRRVSVKGLTGLVRITSVQ